MGDFDRVFITPQYSNIERKDILLIKHFLGELLEVPIISSPMDTITEIEMMDAMKENGGIGIHHRYCDYPKLESASQHIGGIAVCPSMDLKRLEEILSMSFSKIAVLDVAHGYTKRNLDFCEELVKMGWNMVSGNICTMNAAEAYLKINVNHLRVGIGSGSVCTTRIVTGVGRPQYICIPEIKEEFGADVKIIADGGIRTTGDIAKAFALGASFVMVGRMLSTTKEAAGKGKYSGMASAEALIRNNKKEFFVEGRTEEVEISTTVSKVMKEIKDALETTCYYCGSKNLMDLCGAYEIL